MKKEKKEKTTNKCEVIVKAKKGSNWQSLKDAILVNPVESRKKASKLLNPVKSVSTTTLSTLEDLLNPDGTGTRKNTSVIGMDCEMVGVGKDKTSALARVSIVNFYGAVLYDTFVKPPSKVTDYRTEFSGIRPADLSDDKAVSLREAQEIVCRLVKKRIVVGHSISNDFDALLLNHPKKLIRDTAKYDPLMYSVGMGKKKSQKLSALLIKEYGENIQQGEHDSVDDARAALLIYKKYRSEWEESILHPTKREMEKKEQ